MSLIQNIEIDTLRLRNLIVRYPDNSVIPSSHQLYSKGDGGTYWSTGVTAQQFITLSTQVSTNVGNFTILASTSQSSIIGGLSSLNEALVSTLYGFSTFSQNLSTFSAATAYTDQQISDISGYFATELQLYTALESTNEFSTSINLALLSTSDSLQSTLNNMSSYTQSTNNNLAQLSTNVGIKFESISTSNGSTFSSVFLQQSIIYVSTQQLVFDNVSYLETKINEISTTVVNQGTLINTFPSSLSATASSLSTAIRLGDIATLASSIAFTNAINASTISTLNSGLASTTTQLRNESASSITGLSNSTFAAIGSLSTSFSTLQAYTVSSINFLTSDIAVLISTGLVQNIYQTFIELESYSASTVTQAISTNAGALQSTVSVFTFIYESSLNYINTSSYNFLVANAYLSSISTVVPLTLQVTSTLVADSVVTFNSTISSQSQAYSTNVAQNFSTYNANLFSLTSSYISTVSSYTYYISIFTQSTISTIDSYVSTTISSVNALVNINVSTISSNFYTQFNVAPSIVMYSTNNLSTLYNVSSVTGLESLSASIATIDVTQFQNFYILLSDIRNDVFYGMVYSTNTSTFNNKDITIQVDIRSTYTNKFFVFDTAHFSDWLGTPQIYNPRSFSFLSNDASFLLPTKDTTQQVYISSFIGAYILSYRLTKDAMYLKSVLAYPFIYSQLSITSLTLPTNVSTTYAPYNAAYNLMFAGSEIPVSWNTNDLNIPIGAKFIGFDYLTNSTIISWTGPYSSRTGSANIKVPPGPAPFIIYSTMYLGIYPNTPNQNATTDGNINTDGQIFATSTFGKPLGVVSPTLNGKVTVQNPGISRYLQVAEVWVNNTQNENIITSKFNSYARLVSSSSYPYNGDVTGFGAQRAFDGSLSTFFYGGSNALTIDTNAFVAATFSSYSSIYNSSIFISTIEVYGAGSFTLSGMQVRYETTNLPTGILGTFISTMTITATNSQTFKLA